MVRIPIQLTVNGRTYQREVDAHRTLLRFLREDLGLTGTPAQRKAAEPVNVAPAR